MGSQATLLGLLDKAERAAIPRSAADYDRLADLKRQLEELVEGEGVRYKYTPLSLRCERALAKLWYKMVKAP